MLELRSVARRAGAFRIADLDLHLVPGECFILLGPSGAGKTMLLEIVAGLIPPDAGRIIWDGRDITDTPPEARAFAVVYQDYALFPHMTVRENIAYGLRMAGMSRRARSARAGALAEMLGVEAMLDRHPDTLSGGEQQRVALARALAPEPRLLLLDEPLSSLDPNLRARLRGELKRIHEETGTMILHVTHDVEEALYLGDRVGVLLDGRLRQVSLAEELFRAPSDPEVADFLGVRNALGLVATS